MQQTSKEYISSWENEQSDMLLLEEMLDRPLTCNIEDIISFQKIILNSTYGATGIHPSFDINYLRKK